MGKQTQVGQKFGYHSAVIPWDVDRKKKEWKIMNIFKGWAHEFPEFL